METKNTVNVAASGRLHMGFYDLTGANFGSVGLALNSPETQVALALEGDFIAPEARQITAQFVAALGIKSAFSVKLLSQIPPHIGLGSGTQLALAVGAGINALFNLGLSVPEIARIAGRGKRSGIGLAAFAQGGFLVDSGKNASENVGENADALPEIAIRHDFPADWRIILVSDSAHIGVHGTAELQAFQTLKPMQSNLKEMACKHMAAAIKRADLLAFGAYMDDLQAYNGAYFAPVQGGLYASQHVENALNFLRQNGVACVGQSSWGPTGFAIVQNQQAADLQLQALKTQFFNQPNLSFLLAQGYNKGALLE